MYKAKNEIHTIKLSVWENCFLRCSYCYVDNQYSTREYQDDTGVDFDIGKDLIDLLLDSPWERKFLQFIWWEPLMYEDILCKLISYARKKEDAVWKDLVIFFVTNGLLFQKKNLLFFKKHAVKVGISLDGKKFYHDKHRYDKNNNGTYESVVAKVRLVKDFLPIENIGISMTVHPDDVHALSDNFIFLAQEFQCTILTSIASWREWNSEIYELWVQEFKKVYAFIIYSIEKGDFYFLNGLNYLLRESILEPYKYRKCLWNALECFKNGDIWFYASGSKNYNTPYFHLEDMKKYWKEQYLDCEYKHNSKKCNKCIIDYKSQEDDKDVFQVWYLLRERRFESFSKYIKKLSKIDPKYKDYIEAARKNMYFNDIKNEFSE